MKNFDFLLQKVVLIALFVATIGSAYILISTVVLKDDTHKGFFNTWQCPMLFAMFMDVVYY